MDNEARIDDLVDRWEMMRDRGTPPTIEELCADDPALAAEVRRRIGALLAMESALDTQVDQPRLTPVGRGAAPQEMLHRDLRAMAVYRPRRLHDQGGLGLVFTAHEHDLDRIVALKRIRPDKLHDVARRRFLREAALTAQLQHPGIVPIYSLGQDEAGPFYTMPFIAGRTLEDAINAFHRDAATGRDPGARGLRLREFLQHFIAACKTVAYAHDRGVVHRDLKPSNLMLGQYGETLVMDWGLAKRFGPGEAATEVDGDLPSFGASPETVTATGEVLGTPRYMSPEQARGEPVGPAGDVFSLGLVLYAILTGKPAFEEPNMRGAGWARSVREAAIVPPRTRDARLPRALEAICLKALSANAADRYASARALAEDVARWLADEPVTAWREPVSIWARRWMRRHRTAVAAAVMAVLTGAVGLSAVVWVQARANTQLKDALTRSEESRQQAQAVSRFLVDAFRSPDPTRDGREVKVAEVLDRASRKLDEGFSGSQATLGALLNALGLTYQGLGLYEPAVGIHTKASAAREAALGPDHPDTLGSRNNLANAYLDTGRTALAIAMHEETLKRREAALGPDHPDALKSRNNLANAHYFAGRLSTAIALFEESLKRREAALGPDHPDTLTSRNNLAVAYLDTGRTALAIAMHEETLKRREAALGPDHPDTLQSRHNLADAYGAAGQSARAIAVQKGTLELKEAKLGPDHPDTLRSRMSLASRYYDAGRLSDAIALNEGTLKLCEPKLGPDHSLTLITRNNTANAYRAVGRTPEAIALYESTLKGMETNLGPDHPSTLECRNGLAATHESLGRWAEAEGLLRDVLASRRKTAKPDSPLLATALANLGPNLLNQRRWSEAESLLRECLSIREKTNSDDWLRYYTMSLLGGALLDQGRCALAEPLIVEGYEGMKAREARIRVPERFRLYETAERVVRLYEAWGKMEQAAAWKAKLGLPDLPADAFARP
jgi:tetratricopeptide (TPR) repeat protein/tRNA A-37 threonylcarbamoyl transferase component Bud32